MMDNRVIEERIINALRQQEPMKPRRIELGGGYYYKCHWLTCDTDINKFMDFCPGCGQRILWETK